MRRLPIALCILALLAVSPRLPLFGSPSVQAASLDQMARRLHQVLSQLSEKRAMLRLVRRREQRVLDQLEQIDRTKDRAERRLTELSTDYRRTTARVDEVSAQLDRSQQQLADRRSRLGIRLRDMYKYGRTGYAEVLLGSEDFASFVIRWHFLARIVRTDLGAIDGYSADVVRYKHLQTALLRDQAYLQTLTDETQARQSEITAQELAKRGLLQRLQFERAAFERVVRELEQDSRDLEAIIQRAQAAAHQTAVAEAHTHFAFLWPARGGITSGFGMRLHPLFAIWHFHTGVDIAGAWGTPVLAASEGRVLYAGWFGGYGKIVVIDHGEGISTLYGHLSTILVSSGDEVHRGQPIGRIGTTGYSTGPHLHFEIRVNGRPVDPVTQ